MSEDIGLFDAIHSQRAIRLYKADPVPDELIEKILDAAIKAPSSGNRQGWGFLVVKDPDTRWQIAEHYRANIRPQILSDRPPEDHRMWRETKYLADHLHEVPVFILACVHHDGRPDDFARGATIFPAVQNMLLAARGLGLGSVLTTRHRGHEAEIKKILNIPDNVEIASLLPIGFPADGARYGTTRRKPATDVTFYERWGTLLPRI